MAASRQATASRVLVTILKWAKHNPRKDVKRPSWFALDNRMIEDPDFFDFSHAEFKTWLYLLSLASQKQSGSIEIQLNHADRVCRIRPSEFRSALIKLEALGIVAVDQSGTSRERSAEVTKTSRERNGNVREPNATLQDITDNTDNTDITEQNTTSPVAENPTAEVIEPLRSEQEISDFVKTQGISEHTQTTWLKLYDLEYVRREVIKAVDWIHNNPKKCPRPGKGAASFMSSWLARSFDNYRKSIPTNREASKGIDWDKVFNQPGTEAGQ